MIDILKIPLAIVFVVASNLAQSTEQGDHVRSIQEPHVTALRDAIASGDSESVRELLRQHPEFLEVSVGGGMTPLEVAAMVNSPLLNELIPLFESRPDSSELFVRAICWAMTNGHTEAVEELLKSKPPLNQRVGYFLSPLHTAVTARYGMEEARRLVDPGADADPSDPAASGRHVELAKLLVKHGADPNFFPTLGLPDSSFTPEVISPLWAAAFWGEAEILEFFLTGPATLALPDGPSILHPLAIPPDRFLPLMFKLLAENLPPGHEAQELLRQMGNLKLPPRNDRALLERLVRAGADVNAVITTTGITPLHLCATHNHLPFASALLEQGAELEIEDSAGFTALHTAAENGHLELVDLLLRHGADPNTRAVDLRTPLHSASQGGYVEVMRRLLESGADVHAVERNGATALYSAALQGDLNAVELLLDAGATPHARTHAGETPLHGAALDLRRLDFSPQPGERSPVYGSDHAAIARRLLREGAGLHNLNASGSTPLHLAAQTGSTNVVEVLLEHGARTWQPNREQVIPLHLAAINGHVGIVRLLLSNKADLETGDAELRRPLHWASGAGAGEVARLLLEHKADPNARDINQATPAHWAALGGFVDMLELLVEFGADLAVRDRGNQTPLHLAVIHNHAEVVEWLLANAMEVNGMEVNGKTSEGATPLHFAALHGHAHLIQPLLAHGAALNEQGGPEHVTPLMVAAALGHSAVVEVLLGYQPDLERRDFLRQTALHLASAMNQVAIASALIAHGADVRAQSDGGFTPFHVAVDQGLPEMVKLYLRHPSGRQLLDTRLQDGRHALHVAVQAQAAHRAGVFTRLGPNAPADYPAVLRFLLEHGADANSRRTEDETPLHDAARARLMESAMILIKFGANPNALNGNGLTPINLALNAGHDDLAEALLARPQGE
jgi:ankyrin repeat protein